MKIILPLYNQMFFFGKTILLDKQDSKLSA